MPTERDEDTNRKSLFQHPKNFTIRYHGFAKLGREIRSSKSASGFEVAVSAAKYFLNSSAT